MDGKEDFFQDIEKIKALSQFMGQKEISEKELTKAMETAKTLGAMMQFSGIFNKQEDTKLPETASDVGDGMDIYARNRQENVIHAAIPFLDQEYQKDLCIAVRLLEIRRILNMDGGIESRSRQVDDPKIRRRKMLQAVRPYLEKGEQKKVDMMVKTMDVKYIMERKEEQK